jgi:MYXO-CTERM domain-containing protein
VVSTVDDVDDTGVVSVEVDMAIAGNEESDANGASLVANVADGRLIVGIGEDGPLPFELLLLLLLLFALALCRRRRLLLLLPLLLVF